MNHIDRRAWLSAATQALASRKSAELLYESIQARLMLARDEAEEKAVKAMAVELGMILKAEQIRTGQV